MAAPRSVSCPKAKRRLQRRVRVPGTGSFHKLWVSGGFSTTPADPQDHSSSAVLPPDPAAGAMWFCRREGRSSGCISLSDNLLGGLASPEGCWSYTSPPVGTKRLLPALRRKVCAGEQAALSPLAVMAFAITHKGKSNMQKST